MCPCVARTVRSFRWTSATAGMPACVIGTNGVIVDESAAEGTSALLWAPSPGMWFSRFIHLSCPKALIYGEYSLPAQEATDSEAAGIPLLVIPQAGHSMAWENPSALARTLADFYSAMEAEA